MNRKAFESYVNSQIEKGYSAEEIIAEIDKLIGEFGQLDLSYENESDIVIVKRWLENFKYDDFIRRAAAAV